MLDIGCGTGSFLSFAKGLGWQDLTGVEIAPEAAEIAQKLKTAKIYNKDFSSSQFPAQRFAVITLFDIIEHVTGAKGLLERVFKLLKPGGLVIIGTANRQGISMRILGQRALTVCPPEHLTIFSQGGALRLMKRTGFEVKSRHSVSIYLREWMRFIAPVRSSQSRDNDYGKSRANLSNSKAFIAVMKITDVVLNAFNLGDELYFLAQKAGSFRV